MSYYKPSFSQTLAMSRGRGYSPRGSSYRGNSSRGSSSWGGNGSRGGYSHGGSGTGRFSSFSNSMDSRPFDVRNRYSASSSDRFSRPHSEDYHKAYRTDSSYSGREGGGRRSPDRKRLRVEAPSSRHDSSYGGYGPGRHESQSSYPDRRSYPGERHSGSISFSRRDDFRRPIGPPPSRGAYRGRLNSRGSRGMKIRELPTRRRLVDSSYAVRKRVISTRPSDYARRLKISRMRSAIARRATKRKMSDKEESDDEESKEKKAKDETKLVDDKDPNDKIIKSETSPDKDNKSESGEDKLKKKSFIKLNCPHCGIKAITFRKYDLHLSSKTHLIAMRKIALKQKSILAQMRQAQRNTQNELEKNSDDLTSKTNFCPLCKLNYKQKKAVHQLSEAHKNMKKFLMPYCKVCNITFKSPMIYESHCCSIEHIKRKQRMENCSSDISAEEDNLENFTTIDSVGDGDGTDNEDKEEDVKPPVSVGIEQIRKIEAYYCDLCKMYLPRGEDVDIPKILSKHCKLRVHMQRYVRYKEDQDLEKRAEKLQRKEMAEKETKVKKEKDDKPGTSEPTNNTKAANDNDASKCADDEEARDDKLWADVDKDLGDILAEAESGNKSSDEDDDSHVNGERYDRFKLSEKNEDETLKAPEDEADQAGKENEKESSSEKK